MCEDHNQTHKYVFKNMWGYEVWYGSSIRLGSCVKNTLTNNHGFSPAQNFSLLSIMNNRLSALEDHYSTRDLVLNITALHIGRQGFIE